MLDRFEPALEAPEGEWILFARVDDGDGQRGLQLRAAALGDHWPQRRRDGRGLHLPAERGRDEGTLAGHACF